MLYVVLFALDCSVDPMQKSKTMDIGFGKHKSKKSKHMLTNEGGQLAPECYVSKELGAVALFRTVVFRAKTLVAMA